MLPVDQEQKRITEQEGQSSTSQSITPGSKRRTHSFAGSNMVKELSADQKAVVKTYVSRDIGDGNIKCFYCATEITSRSLDRTCAAASRCRFKIHKLPTK
ncbi:hypothetical protein PI124_g6578 [Phytophthora idaei]|nr:hypothetical protein PI125_g4240 [Phytophthora idaei]KAG3160735.1 hypothetical protein PI126_g6770 [Phytophthora idaei]KAG3248734.1 hypothetical protein PI124_g6578 [Phytophthora idaei]